MDPVIRKNSSISNNSNHRNQEKAVFKFNENQISSFKCEFCDVHIKLRLNELSNLLKQMLNYSENYLKKQIEIKSTETTTNIQQFIFSYKNIIEKIKFVWELINKLVLIKKYAFKVEAKPEDINNYFNEVKIKNSNLVKYKQLVATFEELEIKIKNYLTEYYLEKAIY